MNAGRRLDGMPHAPNAPHATRHTLPALAAVATVLMWASSFVIARWSAPDLSPGPLALLRLVAGSATLSVLVLWAGRGRVRLPGRRGLLLAAVCGVLWFGLYTLVFNWAGHFIDAGTIAMVVNLAPLMVAVGGGIFFGEGFPRRLFTGMAASLLGIGLITVAGSTGRLATAGLLVAFAAAVLYAAGMLVQKLALGHTDPLTATWLACAAGLLTVLPFAGQTVAELGQVSAATVAGAVYMGVGPTALGFWSWGYAMNHFPAGSLASAGLAVPAVVVTLSAVTLREVPPPLAIVGGAVCLAGVGLAQWRRPRSRQATTSSTPASVSASGLSDSLLASVTTTSTSPSAAKLTVAERPNL